MLIITKFNSVWLKQTEDLACREHVDGPVPQLDILSSRNMLTSLYPKKKVHKSVMIKFKKSRHDQSIELLLIFGI